MGKQTISQILSPTNATYINGVSAERRISAAILKNMYQGLVEKNGKGINDKFVTEGDAEEAAQIFVNRVLPIKMKPRELGSSKNGAGFSADSHYIQTTTVGIEVLTVVDDPIILPRSTQAMIKVDLLAEQTEIFSNRLNTILNGATAASKFLSVYAAKASGKDVNEKVISSTDVSNKEVLNRFIEANSLLDEGDSDNGIDIFPEDTRIAVFKTSYRAILKTGGILVLGGANYAYDIAKGDSITQGVSAKKSEDGYIGDIDGVPCHLISNESLGHASEFLGFPVNELKDSSFVGYIASSYANARGVSTSKMTKIVDAQEGQGLKLQPYVKFGVISWYPKGNVILHNATGYNPFGGLKTLFPDANIVFKLKGAGSRLFPELAFTAKTNAAFTCTATAKDDFGVEHAEGFHYVVSDKLINTVDGFIAACGVDGAEHGAFIAGVSKSLTTELTAGKYVNVLVVADDGSCSLLGYGYAA